MGRAAPVVIAAGLSVAAACKSFGSDGAPEPHDAGAPDVAATVDAAPGASLCPRDATFCDDFESGTLGKWDAPSTETRGTVAVVVDDATKSHVLQAHTGGDASAIEALANRGFTIHYPSTVAVRAFVKLPSPLGNNIHLLTLEAWPGGGPIVDDRLALFRHAVVPLAGRWRIETSTALGGYVVHDSSSVSPPLGVSTCIELDLTFADKGHASLFVLDQRVVDDDVVAVDSTDRATVGKMFLRAGIATNDVAIPQDVLFDDVALETFDGDATPSDEPRIGCAAKM